MGIVLQEHQNSRYPCIYLYSTNFSHLEWSVFNPDYLRTTEKKYASGKKEWVYAIFDLRTDTRLSAGLNMIRTIFVCIVLVVAALMFNNDTNNLILVPIERMMGRVTAIAQDPIKAVQKKADEIDIYQIEEEVRSTGICGCKK